MDTNNNVTHSNNMPCSTWFSFSQCSTQRMSVNIGEVPLRPSKQTSPWTNSSWVSQQRYKISGQQKHADDYCHCNLHDSLYVSALMSPDANWLLGKSFLTMEHEYQKKKINFCRTLNELCIKSVYASDKTISVSWYIIIHSIPVFIARHA